MKEFNILRGQVYVANLGSTKDKGKQGGLRPCVIVSNNTGNKFSPTVHIIPLTSSETKTELPTHYKLMRNYENLDKDENLLLGEQVQLICKSELTKYITTLEKSDMFQINLKLFIVFFGLQYKPIIADLLNLIIKGRN